MRDLEVFFNLGRPDPGMPLGDDPLSSFAACAGVSPRFCYGFGADIVAMLRLEGSVPATLLLPRDSLPDGRPGVAITCAGARDAAAQALALDSAGWDVAVSALRAGPLAEALRSAIGIIRGTAYPIAAEPAALLPVLIEDAATDPDRLEVAEFCCHLVQGLPGASHLILTEDEDETEYLRVGLGLDSGGFANTAVMPWVEALLHCEAVLGSAVVSVLGPPKGNWQSPLAAVVSLLTFDGLPKILILAHASLADTPGPISEALGLPVDAIFEPYHRVLGLYRERTMRTRVSRSCELAPIRWRVSDRSRAARRRRRA